MKVIKVSPLLMPSNKVWKLLEFKSFATELSGYCENNAVEKPSISPNTINKIFTTIPKGARNLNSHIKFSKWFEKVSGFDVTTSTENIEELLAGLSRVSEASIQWFGFSIGVRPFFPYTADYISKLVCMDVDIVGKATVKNGFSDLEYVFEGYLKELEIYEYFSPSKYGDGDGDGDDMSNVCEKWMYPFVLVDAISAFDVDHFKGIPLECPADDFLRRFVPRKDDEHSCRQLFWRWLKMFLMKSGELKELTYTNIASFLPVSSIDASNKQASQKTEFRKIRKGERKISREDFDELICNIIFDDPMAIADICWDRFKGVTLLACIFEEHSNDLLWYQAITGHYRKRVSAHYQALTT
ncbi:MAG: hypothetical protein KUG67_01480 [Proteobacteria bacterium]|nr:hypothetical protein [Pseudomonadota bacterium]